MKLIATILTTSITCIMPAYAIVSFSHQGAIDPVAQGWTANPPENGVTVGPVQNDSVGNLDAWEIDDNSSTIGQGGGGSYSMNLPTGMGYNTWVLTANVRIVEGIETLMGNNHNSNRLLVRLEDRRYDIEFGDQLDGDPIIFLNIGTEFVDGKIAVPIENAGNGYHSYEMIYDPLSQSVDISVDGSIVYSNYNGFSFTSADSPAVVFGGGSTTGTGHVNWNSVQFSAIPETSSIVLVGIIGLFVVVKMRRSTSLLIRCSCT